MTIDLWIARDSNKSLHIFLNEPDRQFILFPSFQFTDPSSHYNSLTLPQNHPLAEQVSSQFSPYKLTLEVQECQTIMKPQNQ